MATRNCSLPRRQLRNELAVWGVDNAKLTAAQAAQKKARAGDMLGRALTAAQAAQKHELAGAGILVGLTAAQAAQKGN